MPDARHPKPYPRGPKHPKLPITDSWRSKVLAALEANARAGRAPRNEAELARMVRADKGGLHSALHGHQATYKYARQISDILGVADAMVANPELTEDEWAVAVARMRKLTPEQQRLALAILRTFGVDGE